MTEKNYDYMQFGRGKDGKVIVDAIGFVSTKNIRDAKNGDVKSFGLPLENVGGTVSAMFPEDFPKGTVDDTFWLNVAFFNNENFKLADRFAKAIDGKDRVRIRVTGVAEINDYNGKKSIQLAGNDFHILWAKGYKGVNVGGGEDGYSYVSALQGKEAKTAHMAVQGYVNRPQVRDMGNGKSVLGFGLALNKASKKVNFALGTDLSEDTMWVDVAIFDTDDIPFAQRAAKVLRQGAAIAGLGFAKVEEYEGKERINLSLNGFDVLKYAKDGEGNDSAKVPVGAGAPVEDDSPFSGDVVDIDDDDLPF